MSVVAAGLAAFAERGRRPVPADGRAHRGEHEGRHQQDRSRRRDHAGEPVVRHYFGMYPGADGFALGADGLPTTACPTPQRRLCEAVSRPDRRAVRRSPRRGARGGRHQQRRDGRLHRRLGAGLPEQSRRVVVRWLETGARRDVVQGAGRHPELLGVRRQLRVARPHVRPRLRGACQPHVPGVGLVGVLLPASRSHVVRERLRHPRRPDRARRQRRALRLDQ